MENIFQDERRIVRVTGNAFWFNKCTKHVHENNDSDIEAFSRQVCYRILDDIFVFSQNMEEHLEHLEQILQVLR